MAKATLSVELKGDRGIEIRISGKKVEPKTEHFDFPSAEDAQAAMRRAIEWALKFSQTGQIPA